MTHFIQHIVYPTIHGRNAHRATAAPGLLLAVLAILLAAAFALLAPPAFAQSAIATESRSAAVRYRVANLGSGTLTTFPRINSAGQVAFSLFDAQIPAAWTFDGKRIINLGTLGGSTAYANGITERGHVAGWSSRSDDGKGINRAFRWTSADGIVDLGALGQVWSYGYAVNNRDEVAGSFGGFRAEHAFRWSPANGMEDLGVLGTSESQARAINDHGVVTGDSRSLDGYFRAFVWTRVSGIEDIGTLGGSEAIAVAVGAHGEVAGVADTGGSASTGHAFLWTRAAGMRDLGALDGTSSSVRAMSPNLNVVGTIVREDSLRAMTWTPAHGMTDLGTLGGTTSLPSGINSLGQAVGAAADRSETLRAFSWTRLHGMVDLNTRLVNAPAGLFLEKAEAVSDNGAIVASSNAGLVLLRPLGQEALPAPVLGPINLPDTARTCCATTMKVGFTDANAGQYHHVTVDWGDAFMDTALVSEKGGEGSASAHHVYRAPGLYTVVVQVTASGGNATRLRHDLLVVGDGQLAAGSGRFVSPMGAHRALPHHAGSAAFRFVAPGAQAKGGIFSFVTDRLLFRANTISPAANPDTTPGVQRLSGTGELNGKAGYGYTISASGGDAGSQARFGLRIWHNDPASKVQLVDFDNERAGRGSALMEGAIAVAP